MCCYFRMHRSMVLLLLPLRCHWCHFYHCHRTTKLPNRWTRVYVNLNEVKKNALSVSWCVVQRKILPNQSKAIKRLAVGVWVECTLGKVLVFLPSVLSRCSFLLFRFSPSFSFNFIPIGIVSLGCFFALIWSCHSFCASNIGIFSVKNFVQVRLCRRHSTICKHSHTVKQTNNRTHSKMMSSNDLSGIFHVFYIMYEPFLILILYLVSLPFLRIHSTALSGYDQFSFVSSHFFVRSSSCQILQMKKTKRFQTLSLKLNQQLLLQAIYECSTTNRKWSWMFFALQTYVFFFQHCDRFVCFCMC